MMRYRICDQGTEANLLVAAGVCVSGEGSSDLHFQVDQVPSLETHGVEEL